MADIKTAFEMIGTFLLIFVGIPSLLKLSYYVHKKMWRSLDEKEEEK